MATYFESQSDLLGSSSSSSSPASPCAIASRPIRVSTVGIISPLIDLGISGLAGIEFAANNSYGIEILDRQTADALLTQYGAEGGCGELLDACRAIVDELDPDGWGNATEVGPVCVPAFQACFGLTEPPYMQAGVSSCKTLDMYPAMDE